jgi:RHS repeat-associated protein
MKNQVPRGCRSCPFTQLERARLWSLSVLAVLAATPALGEIPTLPNYDIGLKPDRLYQFDELDAVNVFNGNLTIAIPIGGAYQVAESLAYQLTLSYNSKVWTLEHDDTFSELDIDVYPEVVSNAGLGWSLHLGKLLLPSGPGNESKDWVYVSPDGGHHRFHDNLHAGEPIDAGVRYSRDGSYLRLKDLAGGVREVEHPDGTVRRFGSDLRLQQIRDRFGNALNVSYPNPSTWQLSDTQGRTHFVRFAWLPYEHSSDWVVDRVELQAIGGVQAVYQFGYSYQSVERGCGQVVAFNQLPQTPALTVPLLSTVALPDGSYFAASYFLNGGLSIGCGQGALRTLSLPTLGKLDYTYRLWELPAPVCDGLPGLVGETPGLSSRRRLSATSALLGEWSYSPVLVFYGAGGHCFNNNLAVAEELQVTVTTPLKDKTIHYFSVWDALNASVNGFQRKEYASPFTPRLTDGTATSRRLSTEVLDCDAVGNNCVVQRRTYVRFEQDPPTACVTLGPVCFEGNRRLKSQRVVYLDDASRWADTDHSGFDGLGHYRTTETNGNFPSGNVRSEFKNYNPGVGILNLDAYGNIQPGFTMLGTSAPWVLETYTEAKQIEAGVTSIQQFCFDATTGFLLRRRIQRLASVNANDLLAVFTQSGGNLIRERYYGGDTQSISTSTDLCGLAPPSSDAFRIDHAYQSGTRRSSQYFTAAGTAMSFKTLDLDIDASTGLPVTSRDISGALATGYEYDTLGRVTWIKPPSGHGSWVEYVYTRATSSSALANVLTRYRGNGSKTASVVAQERVWFDVLGRLWRDERMLPGGAWSTRETQYDGMSHRASVSEWGNLGKTTQFQNYDAFGRPTRIRPPDGSTHDVTLSYSGDRVVSRTVKVGTTWTGSAVAETSFTTTERYDRQGRLYQVVEPSGSGGATTTTTYGYDVGSRLKTVSMPSQSRTFNYDSRGFLTSEVHPESGTTSYGSYNARGHAGTKSTGVFALSFAYDRAERVTQVQETSPVNRLLKQWMYAASNGTGDHRNGKVLSAARNNYVAIGATPFKVTFIETFKYGGRDGRVSQRTLTQSTNDGAVTETFLQSWVYDVLGAVASLEYPNCQHAVCPSSPRTVTNGYSNGFPTSVTGFATGITYHSNQQVHQVTNANGVVTTYAQDPNAMARPASISSTAGWSTGAYAYDGAGNVTRIGNGRYLYDGVSRLVEGVTVTTLGSSSTTKTQGVAYDIYGNIQSITTDGVVIGTTTSASTNRLVTTGTVYDAAGRMRQWNGTAALFEYDPFGLVWHYTAGAEDWIYMYTADDERVWSFRTGGSANYWALRDLDGKVLREYQTAGGWTVDRDYVYRGRQLLASITPAGTRHFHVDHLGSVRHITSPTGTSVAFHAYHPFGQEATSPTQDTEQMKFTGHERDLQLTTSGSNAGADDLDYMHARYYKPLLGRFTSVDPAEGATDPGLPQSWNRYSYVLGSPMTYSDPTGRFAVGLAPILFNLCHSNGLCSNEILTVTAAAPGYNHFTGLQGLADLVTGGAFVQALGDLGGGIGKSLGDSISNRVDQIRADGGGLALGGGSFMDCVDAGHCKMGMMPTGPGAPGPGLRADILGQRAASLISGSLKRSPSYRSELADRTYQEIIRMARGRGPEAQAAKQMKKLIENSQRLLDKTGGKPR